MTTQTSSASPPPSTPPPKYEVFLSFRGLDTRKGFTDYLYNTLMQKGIHTFRDDEQLDSGEPISTALLKAIEESQISVVILSKNYATSTWCLDELATMVELAANIKSRLILPVFYDVTPSEVREQTGEHFKEVFAQHDKDFKGEPGKVTRWKESLTEIANLPGFDVRGLRYAKEVITKIVERIFAELNNTILTFSNDLKDFIGMDRVNEIKAKMSSHLGSEEVCVVGICGMTGIGKTTIAKALSQGIRNQFEAFSFISKVGEISRKESLFHIQEQLCDHLLNKKVTTRNADDVICKRLCGKRVLIILDNVDELEQIEAVAGKNDAELSNRFGKGSRIIITTTDERLLVNYKPMICRIDKLTQQESLLLFCRKAFKKDHPMDGYEKLSYKFVDYIDGLPLALEVLGSSLRDRSVEYWSSKLVSLKDNKYSIEKKIIDVLKASFDGLENQAQQQIFLDTACFFKGENVCRVAKIFESCGYYPGINITILREKYLISIKGGKLWMHDLLQQMGREIVRGESKKEGERSRLWLHTDALPVLKKNKGTDAVQGIFLSSPQQKYVDLKKDPFLMMDSLRLLKIYNVNFSGCLEYLSDELSFLEWHKYPLKSLPSSFEPDKLVELNLSQSEIELLWEEIESPLEKLVMLNLSDCEKLIKTPDFDKVPNLEHLILKGCISLSEVPDSINLRCLTNFILSGCSKLKKLPNIGEDMQRLRELHLDGTAIEELPTSIKHLNGLTLLNLRDCKNLLSLPDIICTSLTALQILNLLGCSNLKELPENLGSLESLQELDASGTAIREVPTSIKHLTGLILFNLKDCTNLLLLPDVLCTSLTSLQILNLSGCSNLNELPENLGSLDFLQELDASGTAISQVPESISELSQLGELFLDDCSKLQSLPRLPFSIRALSAHNCPLLQSNKITVWPSAAVGLGYINCHIDKDKAHAIPDQHLMLPFHQIFFELPLPANRLATDLVSAVADPMTAQTSLALPPPSTPPPKYEVFLSFRGLDTRKGFTDYLYKTLIQNGIHSFRDDEQLDSGEPISTALLKAIEESQISVVILSKNYATSTWCLDELATMVESAANTKSRLILPVFYDVTPSEVREQTGEHFKEAFAQHDKDFEGEPGKVTRWKESLTEIANLSGFDVRGFRYETKVTEEIVKWILGKLNTCHTFSDDLKDFVGINRVHEIKSNMGPCLEEVRVIGICGMPGIGKSTIAKALSQSIRNQFEAFSFISKIGEISTKESLSHIKEQLCDHLLNNKETTKNVDDVICKRFRGKRVLIILDNVDALEQIKAVAGSDDEELSNRFGKGSRIIITTTNDRLLIDYNPEIYRIEKLTQDEALLLFCRKAFKKDHPTDGFEDLSDEFVDYIDGLPLALEVLGSSLWKRSVEEWSSTLASLKDNNYSGEEKIIDILKVSFDGLKNPAQQEIFLDTACFFRGEDACRIKKIFESCGYHPGRNINILCEKYLLSIVGGKLWMHDLLQQMGREIVRRESKKQGERSRLWHHTDALPVLKKNKGTDAVKGIFLTLPKQQKVHLKEDPFSNLDSLRLLKIHNVKFAECLEYLSDELRFLEWHKYPLKYLPSSFEPHKLVELNLCESEIEQLWEEIERPLEKLVILNLSDCEKFIKAPDFNKVPNLEQLILKGCTSLSEVPVSINLRSLTDFILSGCSKLSKLPEIGEDMKQLRELHLDGTAIEELPTSIKHLNGLTLLNLRDCKNLLSLPDIICTSLTALQILNLLGCSNLNELPENLGSLECLQELNASGTAIRELPTSIRHLTGLTLFNLKDCTNLLLLPDVLCTSLTSLQILNLSGCSNLNELPENLGSLDFLQELDASGTAISQVPESISEISQLGELFLDDCSKLQSLPRLPFSIRAVSAHNCPLLQSNKITVWPSAAAGFSYINCHSDKDKAHAIWLPDQHLMLPFYQIFFERTIRHGDSLELGYRSNNIPEWLSRHSIESTITILLPPDLDGKRKWMGLALCFVCVAAQKHDNLEDEPDVDEEFGVTFNRNHRIELCTTEDPHECPLVINYRDCDLAGPFIHWCYIPRRCFAESSNTRFISASIKPDSPGVKVTMCGTSLIYLADVPEFVLKLNKHQEYCYHGNQIKQETTTPTRIVGQLRRNVVSLLGKLFEGLQRGLPHRYDYGFIFPLRERLEWFSEQSSASAPGCEVNLPLPPNLNNDDNWAGLSLYFVCTLPPGVSRTRTFYACHLYAPIEGVGYRLMHRLMLYSPWDDNAGSHRLLIIYIPRVRFAERLNRCRFIHAFVRTPGVEMCGMRLVYNQDLKGLIQTISHCTTGQSAYYGTGDFTDTKKYKGISLGATTLQTNLLQAANSSKHSSVSDVCPPFQPIDFGPKTDSAVGSQHESKTVPVSQDETEQGEDGVGSILSASGVRTEQEAQEQEYTTSTRIVDQLRRNLVSLLEKLFKGLQGGLPHIYDYGFIFCVRERLQWFSEQSGDPGCTVNLPLPPNLHNDENWAGLSLYVVYTLPSDVELSRIVYECHLCTPIEAVGPEQMINSLELRSHWDDNVGSHRLLIIHVPQVRFPERLNRCHFVQALFGCKTPGVEVEMCGMRLVYNQDFKGLIETISHCTTAADRPVYYGTGDFPYNKNYNGSVGATSLLSNLVGDAESTQHSPVKDVCPPFKPLDVQSEIHSVEEHRSRILLYADQMTKKLWSW